jgi:glucose/mannose transport system substrate-binding protein
MVDLDPEALGGPLMVEAFDRMTTLRGFVDDNFSGRDWNLASAMVINGEALFQIMGDWAKGEFVNAGQTAGVEFQCFRVPGTEGTVTFNSDQFAMFNVADEASQASQIAMASAVMSPEFQVAFNVVKGSVPARTDIDPSAFDACGQLGMAQLAEAGANGGLFGSMAHGHANPPSVQNAMYDVITAQFNGEYDSATAAAEMVTAVELAQ